jgi:hypothetical protein
VAEADDMNDIEARLRHDLEAAQGSVKRLGRDMLLLERVPADPGRFSRPATNVLVVSTRDAQMPYLVFVDEDLRYIGGDPFLASLFAGATRSRGWRPLLLAPVHLTQTSLEAVAQSALRFLGFPAPAAAEAELPPGLSVDWGFREAHPPLVGRQDFVDAAEALLTGAEDPAVIFLTGRKGVGRSAILREVAWRWQERHGAGSAVRVTLEPLLADDLAAWEERSRAVAAALQRLGPVPLLVFDDLHLACAGARAGPVLAAALASGFGVAPSRGTLPDLGGRRHLIRVPEPEPEELRQAILPTVARYLEARHGLSIATPALTVALRLSERQRGGQPGKVIRLLEAATARAQTKGLRVLGPDDLFEDQN